MDEWEMMIFRTLYSVPKNRSLVNLFKQIYISSAKSDKYLNKSQVKYKNNGLNFYENYVQVHNHFNKVLKYRKRKSHHRMPNGTLRTRVENLKGPGSVNSIFQKRQKGFF